MNSLAYEFGKARQDNLKKQQDRWRELRSVAMLISLELDGGGVTKETYDRLRKAINNTGGGWLT